MDINLKEIPHDFFDPPIVVGGKAMEFYGIRKSGYDIDLIVSLRDFKALLSKMPEQAGKIDMDSYIRYSCFEIWSSIRQFDYDFYVKEAVFRDIYYVMSIERLVWMKGLYVSEPKSVRDLDLISKYVMKIKYKDYRKSLTTK